MKRIRKYLTAKYKGSNIDRVTLILGMLMVFWLAAYPVAYVLEGTFIRGFLIGGWMVFCAGLSAWLTTYDEELDA